ncbi:MAG: Translation initiation factor 2, partial [uncultured Blastococcus sp.]
ARQSPRTRTRQGVRCRQQGRAR